MNEPFSPDRGISQLTGLADNLILQESTVYVNVRQEVIMVTLDKVHLCLNKHLSRINQKTIWHAPLAVLVTIVVTLITTTFQDFVLSAATWRATFIISAALSIAWLCRSAWAASRISTSMEDIVSELKANEITEPLTGVGITRSPSNHSGFVVEYE